MKKSTNKLKKKTVAYQIPKQGSLGLLAAGYKGIRAWKKVRDEAIKNEAK